MADPRVPDARWLRIKTLFAGAVEQPPEAVGAWLDARCGDDTELRGELDSLIASHRSDPVFMEAPAIAHPGAARAVADRVGPSVQAAMIGRRLGPYRLVDELGRGGMGVVYLAERDDQAFDRQVAIKMVYGAALHPSLVDRFEAERRILARFEHPNIARLLDAGTDENGTPFAVMEYVQGRPIDVYVREHRLPVAGRLDLFATVCDAVQYSHERLVVHRDIKPGNVLVTADGVPKLLDFGIAKLLDPSGVGTERTRAELRALTPESASPEQVRGDPITAASDVYSLGVLLFRLLTGTSPYPGEARSDVDLARAICEAEAPRPSDAVAGDASLSSREIAQRRRELKGDLDLIVVKALRKEPERRYRSVERLARDIRRHLAGAPVEAAPDSRIYRTRKFLRRHRAGVALAAAVAVTIAAGMTATLLQARAARLARERAERRFNDVRGLARSMIFEVYDALVSLPGSTSARELMVRRTLAYLDRLATEGGADASLQRELATAYSRIAGVQGHGGVANLGQQTAAIESYRKALAIRERLANAAPLDLAAQGDLAATHRDLANVLSSVGDTRTALEHFRSAVSLNERAAALRPSDLTAQAELAWSYVALSDGLIWAGDWQQSTPLLRKALPLFRRAAEAAPTQMRLQHAMATTHRRIGTIGMMQNDNRAALEAYRSALAIDERRLAAQPNNPDARLNVSVDMGQIAMVLVALGDTAGAKTQSEQALAIREELVRADPNDTHARVLLADALSTVALVRWNAGDRAAALDARRSAVLHLEALAVIKPADVTVKDMLARELGEIGLGYAQLDAGRSKDARCRRARPFLARALDAYGVLAAGGEMSPDAATAVLGVQAALTRCTSVR